LTPEEHKRYVGMSHLVYAGLMALFGLGMAGFFIAVMAPAGAPAGVIFFMTLFMLFFFALTVIPSFLAGYALLKGRSWGRIAAIIGAVTAASNFPFGTAVCVYTFWFLFSEPGKAIFEKQNYMLPPGRQTWAGDVYSRENQSTYAPPSTPPDWR
jgi:hypothetical protein